jgi:hypothetical protein
MTKPHYRCIFLIIATNDTPYFNNSRKIWKQYMNLNPNFKCFFIYGKLNKPLEDTDSNDLIFDDVIENNKFCQIQKSLLAFKFISLNYTYDYVIRTNLSTFWNFKLVDDLLNKCPKTYCYSGGHDLSPFKINETIIYTKIYSGVSIILTPDIIDIFINNLPNFDFKIPDDISLGLFMSSFNFNSYDISNKIYFQGLTLKDQPIILENIKNGINTCVFYRVKNDSTDREYVDLLIYKHLLKNIYNITLS